MFIVEFREKLRRFPEPRLMAQTAARREALTEHGRKMVSKWRRIVNPAPAVQDQIWEFLYDFTRCAVSRAVLRGSAELPETAEEKELMTELIRLLYPRADYAAEFFDRILFVSERALAAVKPGVQDRYSPLDTLQCFRRILGVHLWDSDEIARKLKRCREEHAEKVRRALRQVEFEQSRYDSWEMLYLECERRYHQILNRIGEVVRPAGPAVYAPRSPWELRGMVRDLLPAGKKSEPAAGLRYTWKYARQLRDAVTRREPPAALPDTAAEERDLAQE